MAKFLVQKPDGYVGPGSIRADVLAHMSAVFPSFRFLSEPWMKYASDNEIFFVTNNNDLVVVLFRDRKDEGVDGIVDLYESVVHKVHVSENRESILSGSQERKVRLCIVANRFSDRFLGRLRYLNSISVELLEITLVSDGDACAYVLNAVPCAESDTDGNMRQAKDEDARRENLRFFSPVVDAAAQRNVQRAGDEQVASEMKKPYNATAYKSQKDDYFARAELNEQELNEFAALSRRIAETKQSRSER